MIEGPAPSPLRETIYEVGGRPYRIWIEVHKGGYVRVYDLEVSDEIPAVVETSTRAALLRFASMKHQPGDGPLGAGERRKP